MEEMKNIVEKNSAALLDHVESCKEKYSQIWEVYRQGMPACIESCRTSFGENIDGPQGIYWIGKTPLVFFVGRENFEWMGLHDFDETSTMVLPLWFTYFKSQYMAGFWKRIYDISYELFGRKENCWDKILSKIAISNACKCFKPQQQWGLHERCSNNGYVFHEASVIGAPINIFFTKTFNTLSHKNDLIPIGEINSTGIHKYRSGDQIFYQMNHPGRMSGDIISELINDIREELSNITT